ncbi:hypothetical protein F4861DRAFT_308565 [Xylaria intraflava]|nr:hypothetical protein F4861DRAFT_308565 [Xylaria intraflava]
MFFSKIFMAGAVMAATAAATLTSVDIVADIKVLTQKSNALYPTAQDITVVNAPLISVGQGPFPAINHGLGDIINTATVTVNALGGSPVITVEADVQLVIDAFRDFTDSYEGLLNILVVKADLLHNNANIGLSVSALLRGLEHVVDTLSVGLVAVVGVEAQVPALQVEVKALVDLLTVCIGKFEAIAV